MKKRILSFCLAVGMLAGITPARISAEEAELKFVSCYGEGLQEGAGTIWTNLFDKDEESVALINTSISDTITLKPEAVSNISKIRIAAKSFPAWENIKSVTVSSGENTAKIEIPYILNGASWAEAEVDFQDVEELKLEVETSSGSKTRVSALAEIQVFGAGAAVSAEGGEAPRELIYSEDFSIKAKSAALGGWEYDLKRCFDKNSRTTGGLGNVTNGYIVYEFPYPADVTKLSFTCVSNGDWAVPKVVDVKAYNEETVYRAKLTNPEPVLCGTFELQKHEEKQIIELEGDGYKRITHLIVQFKEAYMSGTNAVWGGWKEMEIHGLLHKDAVRTSEIIRTELKSNVEILCDMGIVDGEPTEEYMQGIPTRLDMAKAILRLTGEYDKAISYVGTYNFSDADDENYNLLSYIYAYKCFGIVGDGSGRFLPYEPLTPRACYKMILSYLGYSEKDFTWDNLHSLCYKLGIGDMIYEESFTNKDMCNAIYESFYVPKKDTDTYFVDMLYEAGRVPDTAWKKISDKQDRVTPILDGDYQIPDTADRNGEFTFTYNEKEHILSPASFCYNAPFHYAGIYYGTLPADNPLSKREEFAEALERAGGRALRFPGGTPAHQYLIEGEKYGKELYDKSSKLADGWSGLYDPYDYNDAFYVDFYDWLDFCKEYNVEPVFQTNPSFFVDDEGVVRQAYPCLATKATDEGILTEPSLYDHNRIDEAIAAFERNLDEIVERGYEIKYWEIGNEDNYKNYSVLPITDPNNPLTQDWIKAVTGYARAIKARFPEAHIIVCAGFPYKELMLPEDFALLTAITRHYPFGRWTIPPVDEKTSAARLARTNEQNFVTNYSKEKLWEDQAAGNLVVDDTETMTWRFEGWDPSSLQHTFAQALNTAHNWGELVFDSGYIGLNVMHDLESPWFGSVVYDVSLDVGSRYMRKNQGVEFTVHRDDVPDIYKFEESYYFNPSSRSFEILGQHIGGRVLTNSRSNVDRFISGYASATEDEVMFTIVNRFNETIPVSITLPNISVAEQVADAHILQGDYLRAVLEIEYNIIDTTIDIKGNNGNQAASAIEFEAMPQSVTHFTVKLDSINK